MIGNWFRLLANVSHLLDEVSTDTTSIRTTATPSYGTAGELRFQPPYSVEEYIHLHLPRTDARRFAIKPTCETFVTRAVLEDRETGDARLFKRWKYCGGRRDTTVETHTSFMDMPFIISFEEVAYKGRLAAFITQLRNFAVVLEVLLPEL